MSLDMVNVLTVLLELSQQRQVRMIESTNTHYVVPLSPPLKKRKNNNKKKKIPKLRVVLSGATSYQTQGANLLLSNVLQVPMAAEQ